MYNKNSKTTVLFMNLKDSIDADAEREANALRRANVDCPKRELCKRLLLREDYNRVLFNKLFTK